MTGAPYELAWYGCDLRTGNIVEELPALAPSGPLSRRLGEYTTANFTLALDGAPAGWEAATDQGRTVLVSVDTETNIPVWSGLVLTRDGGSGPTVQLGTATMERYFDSRYTGDYTVTQQDKADVITGLASAVLTDGPPIVFDAPQVGSVMDVDILDGDDRTVLSALKEVMGAKGGPEWTVDTEWNASRTGFQFPLRVRPAIGTQSTQPEAVFDYPGCISEYTTSESYEAAKGATVVQARGEGEGSARLTSAAHIADSLIAGGWPRWVYRFTPASGLTDPTALDAHAVKALALMATGANVWSAEAVASQAPRLGRDFTIGDSVRIAVESSHRHPSGAEAVARCWAWELDPKANKVRPILVEEN